MIVNANAAENDLMQFEYENEDTSVYFMMDFSEAEDNPETFFEGSADSYINTGLSASINLIRPSVFAFEAMPVLLSIAKEFNLLILNPQSKDESSFIPRMYTEEELIDSWRESNDWAVTIPRDTDNLFLPRERLVSIWKYHMSRSSMQNVLGNDYFVPRIFIVKKDASNELLTAITWSESIPQLIPECDLVIVSRKKAGFLNISKKREQGIVKYSELIQKMGSILETFDGTIPGIKILKPGNYKSALKIFNSVDIHPHTSIEGVPLDVVIDAPSKEFSSQE
jgi:hypothetical protein